MLPLSRSDYFRLPNKNSVGIPTQFYFDPQIGLSPFYIWPTPTSVDDTVTLTMQRKLLDFDLASDTPDFPAEWLDALTYGLAHRLSPEYGLALNERQYLKQEALEMKANAMAWDQEPTSIFLQPDYEGYR